MLDEPRLLAANPWAMRRPITVAEYQELWIVDLTAGEVEVCRHRQSDDYSTVQRIGRGGVLGLELLPSVRIQASVLFR